MKTDEVLQRILKLAELSVMSTCAKDKEAVEHFRATARDIEKALGDEFFNE